MPRVMGVDIPNEKRIDISLQYLYGIGPYRAKLVCQRCNVPPETRARDLKEDELARIASFIDTTFNDENLVEGKSGMSGPVEGALRRKTQMNVQRLKKINSYRGLRHIRGLPVRGQRTRTNSRTRKGKRKTVAVKVSVKAMR
ncbi:MAG: 30S ribosomal protein S13 [Planctomycetota bacterium]